MWTDQFDNTANRDAHFATTGPEIWDQTGGRIDGFVCATGTGGSLAGVSRFLKSQNKDVKVFLADPPGSVLYSWVKTGKLERSGSSVTEGIGQGRITANLEGTDIDDAITVPDERSIETVFRLAKREGLFVGSSSALNVVAAGDMARALGPGHTIVTLICDNASRYQSRLFSKSWLEAKGLLDAVPDDCRRMIAYP